MKEYGILQRHGEGVPFMIHTFTNVDSCISFLYNLINYQEERRHIYFVDNDFFENKYGLCSNVEYFCIKVRDITEWTIYEEKFAKDEINHKSRKIINFYDFK